MERYSKEDVRQWRETLAREQDAWAALQAGTGTRAALEEAVRLEAWLRDLNAARWPEG